MSEQKYPVNLHLLLLFSISLLFSNSFKIDKISQSCVVKRVSLSSCKALEWFKLWAEIVHICGGDVAILEELFSFLHLSTDQNISDRRLSVLDEMFTTSAYDLLNILAWVISLFFVFYLDYFWNSDISNSYYHASVSSSSAGIVSMSVSLLFLSTVLAILAALFSVSTFQFSFTIFDTFPGDNYLEPFSLIYLCFHMFLPKSDH